MQSYNLTIIISLINLGFLGGFSHCSGMCGPFVLSQVSSRLQNISLNNFDKIERLRSLALLPYHLGRITTYCIIAFFCSLFSQNIKEIVGFNIAAGSFLILAAALFAQNLFETKFIKFPSFLKKFSLSKFFVTQKIKNIIDNLFKKPIGFNGFLLGLILGFIPCGLLYGAFALSASISNPLFASFAMLLFGIATFPALFLTASGGYLFLKLNNMNFKIISKIVILINAITLSFMGIGLIFK